jgi:hypothetical protein
VNCNLAHSERGRIIESAQEKGGKSKELISAELSVNKCWKGRKANSRWRISHFLKQGR